MRRYPPETVYDDQPGSLGSLPDRAAERGLGLGHLRPGQLRRGQLGQGHLRLVRQSLPGLLHPGHLRLGRRRLGDATAPGWAVAAAGLAPVVLIGGWLIAGVLQPGSYSPLRETMSVMAGYGGSDRWVMTSALVAVGGCYLVTAAGLACVRRPARALLVIAGLCSFGIAASPVHPGGPGMVHVSWTVLGALIMTAWPAVAGWGLPYRPLAVGAWTRATATVGFAVMMLWILAQAQGGPYLGLAERAGSSAQALWPFVVAVALRRAAAREARPTSQVGETAGSGASRGTLADPDHDRRVSSGQAQTMIMTV